MSAANGLRVLVAERKSRKGIANEDARYRRQENKNVRTAEANGHVVVAREADTVSSQTLPWQRRNLRKWFTEPSKVAQWDAVLVSEVARASRGNSDAWFEIEQWFRANGKYLMDGDGLIWPSADDKEWDNKRRAAREYWESVRDAHADVRADIRAAGAAMGRAPFGYVIVPREDGYKTFAICPVAGPLVREAFERIADGRTASSVAEWLSEVAPIKRKNAAGVEEAHPWRVKRVIDMIARRTYLGSRDGHEFPSLLADADAENAEELALDLFERANAAQASRSCATGGRRTVHAYSGSILCECGAALYRHKSERGFEKYTCSRGRRGIGGEATCGRGTLDFAEVNAAVDATMSALEGFEYVMETTGGDHAKRAELRRLDAEMAKALKKRDMRALAALTVEFERVDSAEAAPIETKPRRTGRTRAERWLAGSLADKRAMLVDYPLTIEASASGVRAALYEAECAA